MIRAKSTDLNPTHHIRLSDVVGKELGIILTDRTGQTDITSITEAANPTTAIKIAQGTTGYDDSLGVYSPQVQSDWSGGRGAEDFDSDRSKFYDNYRTDTVKGNVILGPKETYTTGYYTAYQPTGSGSGDYLLYESASVKFAASKYTSTSTPTVRKIRFMLKTATSITYPFTVTAYLYSDSSGPSTLLATSDPRVFATGSLTSAYQAFDFAIPPTTLTGSSTVYWIAIGIISGKRVNVQMITTATGNAVYKKTTSTWSSDQADKCLNFSLLTNGTGYAHFFEYKGQLYCVTAPEDQGAGGLFMNGYRGCAVSTFTDKYKLNTNLNLSGIDLTGKILKITAGPGSKEEFPYRTIASNTTTGTNDSITVDKIWKTTFTTSTEYVILGCDTWQAITGTDDPDYPVTSVISTDGYVYMAQGDNDYISRYEGYNVGGTWTNRFANDGTNKADFLSVYQTTTGARKVVRGVLPNQVSEATAPTSWANLSFGTAVKCGSSDSQITGITIFGTPSVPYVMKEDEFGYISSGIYTSVPLSEMANVANRYNGRIALRHDIYLYFSLLENGSLERYYNNHLDDIGLSTGTGLPPARRGPVSSLIGYPGRFYVAVDGGDSTDHYSSVYCWNQLGWNEVYRAPGGKRIRKLWIQDLPGKGYQRLWISEEEDLVWVYVTLNPLKCTDYQYALEGSITSPWKYANFKDIDKFWYSEKLFTQNLSDGHREVLLEYQYDNEADSDTWHTAGSFVTSPSEEVTLDVINSAHGIRYRSKLTLTTDDSTVSPEIKAELLHAIVRQPVKHAWNITFAVIDQPEDLLGYISTDTAKDTLDQLKAWVNSTTQPCPLTMDCVIPYFDGVSVFIEPASVKPLKVITEDNNPNKVNKLVCTATLVEV